MGVANIHWGLVDDTAAEGSYEHPHNKAAKLDPGLVLTEAGEILISRRCISGLTECAVAIVVGRAVQSLSRPQAERIERSFDLALSITGGARENVHLRPVPHHWRFARADYLTLQEWQEQRPAAEANRNATVEQLRQQPRR